MQVFRWSFIVALPAWVGGCGPAAPTGAVQSVLGTREFAASESSIVRIQVVVSGADFDTSPRSW